MIHNLCTNNNDTNKYVFQLWWNSYIYSIYIILLTFNSSMDTSSVNTSSMMIVYLLTCEFNMNCPMYRLSSMKRQLQKYQ